jgi:hypothetical protein
MATLIWGCIFGFFSSYVAKEKGRNYIAWTILGFFFGAFALLIVLCLPDKNK